MPVENKIIDGKFLRCVVCKKIKALDDFYVSIRNKSGRRGECIECSRKKNKEWETKNKEQRSSLKICRNCGEEFKPKYYREFCYKRECTLAYRRFLAERKDILNVEYKYEPTGRKCSICGEEIFIIYKRTFPFDQKPASYDFWVCTFNARFHCVHCKDLYYGKTAYLGDNPGEAMGFA